MEHRIVSLATQLTSVGVRRPIATLGVAALATGLLLIPAARLRSEVGYAGYFGPDDSRVVRLTRFLEEFDSGLHVLVVFSCRGTALCEYATDEATLDFVSEFQADLDALPNVRRTWSMLNSPMLVAPLQLRTIAHRKPDGRYVRTEGWQSLASRASNERFLRNRVISADGRSVGLVVEIQSLDSDRMRAVVHGIRDLLPRYEERLGADIYLAGDPVWTVISSDDLNADSTNLTALMFVVITALLWILFRSFWLTVLPVIAVGALTGAVHGVIALLGIPMTSILAALPPVLVVIMITASVHLMTAFLRNPRDDPKQALLGAAGEVGSGCFWAAATTAGGFASFLWSDLSSFRHFGGVAAIGLALSFLMTFTVLPALVCLRAGELRRLKAAPALELVRELLATLRDAVERRPRFILLASLLVMSLLAVGIHRAHYETNFGFGESHYVYRSLRYIEANFRKPMTTEVVVDVPAGRRVYDAETLRLLARIENYFEGEPSTGHVWSFLDFVEEAYRIDKGEPAASFEQLVAAAPAQMPLLAAQEQVLSFWSESASGNGELVFTDRARISVDRAWLDDDVQGPYVDRLRAAVEVLNAEYGSRGYRIELEGGLILADLFVDLIRDTQWRSFGSALAVVSLTLVLLLWRTPRLALWALMANVLPAAALLGTMGWAGIGIDPANSMVAAILIAIAVDDTIHMTLRYRAERRAGHTSRQALAIAFDRVGEAVVITSVCLAFGFSVLMFSNWGGLVSFGLLATLGVLFALVCDLLLLPAALLAGEAGAECEAKP